MYPLIVALLPMALSYLVFTFEFSIVSILFLMMSKGGSRCIFVYGVGQYVINVVLCKEQANIYFLRMQCSVDEI